jgi:hypothetical protein
MRRLFSNLRLACLLSVGTLLLSLQSMAEPGAAVVVPKLPERVTYNCDFYLEQYLPDAPRLEFSKLTELFLWIKKRIAGDLRQDPGQRFVSAVESGHWRQAVTDDEGRFIRSIWLIPSSVTNKGNPMNVLLERRGGSYTVTRIYDEYLQALGFYGYSGELIDKITHKGAHYCQAEETLPFEGLNSQ